jgi:hypothetical protein
MGLDRTPLLTLLQARSARRRHIAVISVTPRLRVERT